MADDDAPRDVTSATSDVWKGFVPVPGTPPGFTVRTTYPTDPDGIEVMLECWEPGSAEPPHSHPGDDMTVVVEGSMSIQFYRREDGSLVPDGDRVPVDAGDAGYVRAGRIHDARYVEACRLVYVHNGAFAFYPADEEVG
jgi:quercetin dioxygenase-like cupin family protein